MRQGGEGSERSSGTAAPHRCRTIDWVACSLDALLQILQERVELVAIPGDGWLKVDDE